MVRKLVPLVALALVLSACGNVAENIAEQAIERGLEAEGGGNVDIDIDNDGEGSVQIQSDDGDVSINIGGGELPDGLPMPVPNGYEVVGSSSFTTAGQTRTTVTLEYSTGALDALVETYEDYFSGFDDVFETRSNDDASQLWSWATGDGIQSVAITAYDGDDYVTVALLMGDEE